MGAPVNGTPVSGRRVHPFEVEGELEPGMPLSPEPPSQEFEGLRMSVSAEFSSPTSKKVSEASANKSIEIEPSKWKKATVWMSKGLPKIIKDWKSVKKSIPTSSVAGRERPKKTDELNLYADEFWKDPKGMNESDLSSSGEEGVKRASSGIHASESDEKGIPHHQSKEIQRLARRLPPKQSPDRKDWLSQNYWDDKNAESTLVGEKDPSEIKATVKLDPFHKLAQSSSKPFDPTENDESTLLGEEDPSSLKSAVKPDGEFVLDLPRPSAFFLPVQKSQKPSQVDSKPFDPAENDESTLLGEEDPSSIKPAVKSDGEFVLDLPRPSASFLPVQKSQKPSQVDSKPFDPAENDESTLLGEDDPSGLKPAVKADGKFVLDLPHPSASQPPVHKSQKSSQADSKPFDPAENDESTLFGEDDPSNLPISPKPFDRPSGAFVLDDEKRPSGNGRGNGLSLSFRLPLHKAKTSPPPDFHEPAFLAKENEVDEYQNTDDDPAQVRNQPAAAKPYIMRLSEAGLVLDLERLGNETPYGTLGYEPEKRSMTQSLRSLFKSHHASSSSSSHLPDVEGETQGPDANGGAGLPEIEEGDLKLLEEPLYQKFVSLIEKDDGAYVLALMKLCENPNAKCSRREINYLKTEKWLYEKGHPINPEQLNKFLGTWCLITLRDYLKSIQNKKLRYKALEIISNMCLLYENGFKTEPHEKWVVESLRKVHLLTKNNVLVTHEKISDIILTRFEKHLKYAE